MNTPPTLRLALIIGLGLSASACTGEIRESTTGRTATEQLLISTAAERAAMKFEPTAQSLLKAKRVAIDDSRFESVDKPYVLSALRNLLARSGATLVGIAPESIELNGKKVNVSPDFVLELRSATLGIKDSSFGLGIPPLPFPIPNTSLTTASPSLYLFYRDKQEGWARFQFWLYEPVTRKYVTQSPDLWGHAYYSKWTFFGIGPFDYSEDIYPESTLLESMTK